MGRSLALVLSGSLAALTCGCGLLVPTSGGSASFDAAADAARDADPGDGGVVDAPVDVADAAPPIEAGEDASVVDAPVAEPPSTLRVELTWSTEHGDVDLHVLNVTRTPPNGWSSRDDCYYDNPMPDWGPEGPAANPRYDEDITAGFGPENVTITESPSLGRYHVAVHYFCDRNPGARGPTDATVRVYCDENLIATYEGIALVDKDDWVTVASIDVTESGCAGTSIGERTIGEMVIGWGWTC